ncbi:MAG TPA: OsmC family protein [Gammaproteobacteria bacterium]|nr:OsmC family protein [Gammaproteobacteria bacterium]
MTTHKEHHYTAVCSWRGSTGAGYEQYGRTHEMSAPPAKAQLKMSSDPAFRGDLALLNPEQLLLMAAASCQMLSFLAIAARKRLDVVEYEDRAEGFMPEDDRPIRVTRITLHPRIVLKGPADPAAVQHAVELGHEQCFIANSLKTDITIEPEIVIKAN